MAVRIQLRRDTATNWISSNPVLRNGEIGIETDTLKMKVGNGSSTWNQITNYMNVVPDGNYVITDYILASQIGAENGVVGLSNFNAVIPGDSIILEGSTDNAYETKLVVLDPTADRTITFPNADGTVALTSDIQAAVNNLIDGAPGLLDTLNELAAAINDDPTFFTSVATNLSNHESDTTSVHGIVDTAELATKTFAAELLTNSTKSNITITGDKNGLTITAENGVADSTTSDLAEGTNLYFTNERAQDAVGNHIGTGLSYNDTAGEIKVDTTVIQERVANVSDTEISYLANVTSDIQSQLDSKLDSANLSEAAQDAVNSALVAGTGLDKSYDDLNNTITFDIDSTVATKTYADNAATTAENAAKSYTDDSIDQEVSDRNTAISNAINAISTSDIEEGTNLYYTDSRAKAEAALLLTNATKNNIQITKDGSNNLTITAENGVADSTTDDLDEGTTNLYFTNQRALDATTAAYDHSGSAAQALLDANTYTDGKVSDLVNGAPALLDTLNELAAAINDDESFATTVTSAIGEKVAKSGDTMTGALILPSDPVSNLQAATKQYVDSAAGTAQSNAESYADGLAVNYDANGAADAAETAANLYTDNSISTEVTNRNSAISTAKGEAISDANDYTDGEITTALSTAQGYATTAEGNANDYTDGKISQEVLDRNSAISSAINAVSTSDIEEGTNLYFTDERAQDAVGLNIGTGLSYNDSIGSVGINYGVLGDTLLDGVSGVTYGLIGTSTYLDIKNTNGYNKEIELDIAAVESKLDTDGYITTSSTSTLTNKTLTSPKINEDVEVTATSTELNILDGITASTSELNILDGATLSTTELNYIDGVTSSVQDQLDDKSPIASPTFTGTVSVDNIEVSGALTFSGTATQIDQTNLTISDPLIYLADGNTANINDLGFVANYNDGVYKHTGLARDASDNKWKLFNGVTDEPTNTVNFAQGTLDVLAVSTLEGNVLGNVTGDLTGNADTATALDTARNIAGQAFDGTADISIAPTDLTGVTATASEINILDGATLSTTELNYVDGVTSSIQNQLDNKLESSTASSTYAPINSPTFTGTVSGITKSMVGLSNVDNTSDIDKPISTDTQNALDLKSPIASPTFTGTVTLPLSTSGYVTTDSSGVISSVSTISNSGLTNSKVTVGTTDISLGSSSTTLDGLTSVSSTSFTGELVGNASTVTNGVYTTDTATVTNTMLAGSIENSKLNNSSISINGAAVELGGSISGLAELSSPSFTGNPTAPTQFPNDNSTNIATTAYADAAAASAAAAIVNLAPTALDTLNELAAALGNDENYAATITTALGNKQDKVSGVSDTEIGYLSGVTGSIQSQLDDKLPTASYTDKGVLIVGKGTSNYTQVNVGTDGYLLTADSNETSGVKWAPAPISLPEQSLHFGEFLTTDGISANWTAISQVPSQDTHAGKFLTTDGSTASWSNIDLSPYATKTGAETLTNKVIGESSSTLISTDIETALDTIALDSFVTAKYLVSIKQGSKIRSSEIIIHTDGFSVEQSEFGIMEMGGAIAGVLISANIVSTDMVLQATITDGSTTNATVKIIKMLV